MPKATAHKLPGTGSLRGGVGIRGTGRFLPNRVLTNEDVVRLGCPKSTEWIAEKTGVRTRHVVADNEAMSDLAIPAIRSALAAAAVGPDEVDTFAVIGDYHDSGGVELTSATVAHALGADGATTLDWRAGCPASVLGLHQGAALVGSDLSARTVVAAAEVNSKGADYRDPTAAWFGDGSGAAVLERCSAGTGILATYAAGTGEGSQILAIPAGGSREPFTPQAFERGRTVLRMDGKAVFTFAVDAMMKALVTVTRCLELTPNDLDVIVPHQANVRIVAAAMEKLGLPVERAYVNLDRVGNTAGASVLIALSEAIELGAIRPRQLIATVGFGGGLAWGAQVIRVNAPEDFWDPEIPFGSSGGARR